MINTNMMKYSLLSFAIIFFGSSTAVADSDLSNTTTSEANQQIISVSQSSVGSVGGSVQIDITYSTSNLDNTTTGLGFRLHYNSNLMEISAVNYLLQKDLLVDVTGPLEDNQDHDNDASTDQYYSVGWASLNGDWPNEALPANVLSLQITIDSEIEIDQIDSTPINFSATALASGYQFLPQNYNLELTDSTWDFDGSCDADALTDGLILLRAGFDLRGEYLISNVMHPDATLTAADVEARIEKAVSITDIDSNGGFDALTDGLLLLRYLFDFRDQNLVSDVLSQTATRTSGDAIAQYIEQYMPNCINDTTPPVIISADTAIAIDENSGAGQLVYTAMAIDTDFNGAEYITFNLINEGLGFSIDNATGDVTTNADFAADYEDTELQSFTVVATDAAGNSSEQVVSVAINNLDEVAPSITSGDTATAVNENSGADQVVYTATADDSADTSDGVTFSLADEALGFSIDTATGVVTTNDDFTAGYEYAQSQSFTLVATDAAGNASEQVVSVAINNLDEVAPSITSGDTATAIDENSGEGQVVYTATASDTDFNGLEDITFSLADNSLGFSIDADGVVTTNASFEANYEDAQSQSFTVVATDATGNFSEQVVSVAINNLDEAAPSITSGDTATDIDENSGEGQVVYTATATDDADASDGFSFSLADESVGFSIDASTGVVTTNADFAADYEDAQSQSFTVIATDVAGNAADNAGQVVSVAINNLDEVAPSITSGDTADAINENTGTGQVVYAATADDSADISAGVTFSLTDSDPALSIDPSTGAVTLSADADVDYETQSQYSFTVVASDGVNDAVEQSVTLDINNLDEIPPTISLIQYLPIIDENSQSGQIAFESLAIDDSDISGGVTFSLSSGSDPALSIDPNTGIITLWHSPDYEQQSEYNFTVIATDAAGNSSEPLSETFEINNLDEVAPSITSGDTATAINENSGTGQVVYTATADDSLDISAGLTFSLAGDSDPALSINSLTGVVTLATDPDYETQSQYSFTVVVSDGVNEAVDQSVTLEIYNLDEIAPTITSAATATAIDENSGAEQVIYTVMSTDLDDDEQAIPITFSPSDSSDPSLFIDPLTGEVTLLDDPDYETQSQYSFAVVAMDAAGNVSETQSVSIEINNLDEVAPSITSAAAATAIDENSGSGQLVYTVTAEDSAEDVSSAPISFNLTSNSDPALSIDSETGAVVLSIDPDYEIQNQYNFAVIAIDGAGNSSEAQSVILEINDLNDTGPTITSGDTATAIDENSGSAQLIYTAAAYDPSDTELPVSLVTIPELAAATQHVYVSSSTKSEDGTQETIVISYNADDSTTTGLGIRVYFDSSAININEVSNILPNDLTVSTYYAADDSDLDSDPSTDQYIILAWTSFSGTWPGTEGPVDLATITFDINVNATGISAINFTAPISVPGFDFAGQTHNLAITNPPMTFSLSVDSDPAISIDSSTGDVFLNNDPDYEVRSQYNFAVIATNALGVESEAQPVTFDINNLDEISPIFISASAAAIDENFGFNKVVYTAIAHDSEDISGGVTFGLFGADETYFTIDESSGKVRLIDNPDFEAQNQYYFTVIADDGVNASVEQQVMLEINNLDDSAPIFNPYDSVNWIDENSGPNQFVFQVEAIDPDFNNNDYLIYSLSGTDAFTLSIDPFVGYVSLIPSPDYESQTEYSFTAIAIDGAGNTSESLPYTLYINNLDEVAPTITSYASNTTSVNENSGAGQVVYTATASDTDFNGLEYITFSLDIHGLGFSIDADTGVVTTNDDFAADYENAQSQSFTVVATDAEDNASQQMVSVAINNLDEVAPTITSDYSADSIDENSGAGQVIYIATADDSADISAGVTFSLFSESDPALSIDSLTGEVMLTTDPNYETQNQYSFTVVVSDGVNNPVEQLVTLDVNNLDDTAPIITSGNTAFGIFDNTGASQIVYRATAVDSDNIGGATFSLVVGSDIALDIDPSTGEVTLNSDSYGQTQYSFAVIATDAAGNESAAKSVTLDILDNSTSDTNILLDMTAPFSSEPNTETPPTIITSETGDTVYNIPAIHFANEQNPDAYGGFAHNTLTSGLKLYNWEGAEAGQAYLDAVVADAAASVALYAAEDALDLDPENEDREAAWVAAATEAKTAAQNLRDANYYSNTLTFGSGGYIYFKGSVPSGADASLIFMIFHYQVDPITGEFITTFDENGNTSFVLVDNESFTTDPITIKGSEESYYAVKIDSTGKQGNMITMFFSPPDTDVMISDVRVITTAARDEMVRGPYFFNNVFSGGPVGDDPATEEIETYMPLGIDGNLLGSDNALPPIEITNEGATLMVPSAYFEDPDADGEVDNPGAFSGFGLDSDAIPDLNSRPLTFGEGGKITFMGSVESGEADVRFRLERIGSEFFLETEPSCTMQTTIIGSGLTEYTVFVPPQAKRTFEYMVMYIDTPDTEVTLSNVLIETSPIDPTISPVDCGSDAALYGDKELDMTAPYGDATIDVGTDDQGNSIALFRVDSAGADNFAGYAVNNGDDPSPLVSNPAAFGAGGAITFTASIPALQQITDTEGELVDLPNPAASVDLRFKFERESSAEPDNCITEPSFTTEVITVSGAEQEYTIDIPIPIPNEYGEGGSFNTYQSFIMELLTADTQVQISNITLSTTPPTRGIYARPPTCFAASLPSQYFDNPITANDFDGDGITDDVDDDIDNDGIPNEQDDDISTDEIEADDPYNYSLISGITATFRGTYGGAGEALGSANTAQSGDQFTFPSDAGFVGGWSNDNQAFLPIKFPNFRQYGRPRIAFCASAPAADGDAIKINFKVENFAWPKNFLQALTEDLYVPRDGVMRPYLATFPSPTPNMAVESVIYPAGIKVLNAAGNVIVSDGTSATAVPPATFDTYYEDIPSIIPSTVNLGGFFSSLQMYIDKRDVAVTVGKVRGNWNDMDSVDFWGKRPAPLKYQTSAELDADDYCGNFPDPDGDGDGIKDNRDLYPDDNTRASDVDLDNDEIDDLLDSDIDGDGIINEDDSTPYGI